MTKLGHILSETFRNLGRHPLMALSSLLSLLLIFLLFDLFWVGAATAQRFYDNLLQDLRMEVFVREDIPESGITSLRADLKQIQGVAAVQYVSKEEARRELRELVGTDLLVGYDTTNPLPRSFVVTPAADHLSTDHMQQIETSALKIQGVSQVYYSQNWLHKAESTTRTIQRIGTGLGLLILAAALIASFNNIRLMTRTRAVGFRQMFLQGAGRMFVATPFVLEGMLISTIAAASGWLLLWWAHQKVELTQLQLVLPDMQVMGLYCVCAALLGLVSGYLGIRSQLR